MMNLIAVISEKPVDGRYQVYAILDPKSGLLYMIYEMGRSIKMGYKYDTNLLLHLNYMGSNSF
jgi:hypothetical protein